MTYDTVIENAKLLAKIAHGDQKYSNRSYLFHLHMVTDILNHYCFNLLRYGVGGWLHDVVEDTKVTKVTRQDIEAAYGQDIAAIVWACTGIGANRKERNAFIYAKLARWPDARPVKLADRMANMHCALVEGNSHFDMYVKEHEDFSGAILGDSPCGPKLGEMYDDYIHMLRTHTPLSWVPDRTNLYPHASPYTFVPFNDVAAH